MRDFLSAVPLISEIEYASVYDPETLEEAYDIQKEALLAVAVRIGNTRLIDNIFLMR
jgi:pantoate--beta-alanine ligase